MRNLKTFLGLCPLPSSVFILLLSSSSTLPKEIDDLQRKERRREERNTGKEREKNGKRGKGQSTNKKTKNNTSHFQAIALQRIALGVGLSNRLVLGSNVRLTLHCGGQTLNDFLLFLASLFFFSIAQRTLSILSFFSFSSSWLLTLFFFIVLSSPSGPCPPRQMWTLSSRLSSHYKPSITLLWSFYVLFECVQCGYVGVLTRL